MREFACLMLDYKMPEFIKELQKKIPEDELYFGETKKDKDDNTYGIENESHITLVYGLENDVKFKDLKKYLYPIDEYKTILINISVFKNDKFDVLKAEAKCPMADKSNKCISNNFDVNSDYNEYKPHMTIAYMKKGKADKYKKAMLDKIEDMTPHEFDYSYSEDGKDKNDFYKKI
jgi:2'-5' RNA ligase